MQRENLQRLTELCAAFHHAVNNYMEDKPKLKQKGLASLKPGEMEALQEQMSELSSETLKYAFGEKPSDDFLKMNIAASEVTADLSLRVLPPKEVAKFLPAQLKNDADAAALKSLGATKLASLCTLKK